MLVKLLIDLLNSNNAAVTPPPDTATLAALEGGHEAALHQLVTPEAEGLQSGITASGVTAMPWPACGDVEVTHTSPGVGTSGQKRTYRVHGSGFAAGAQVRGFWSMSRLDVVEGDNVRVIDEHTLEVDLAFTRKGPHVLEVTLGDSICSGDLPRTAILHLDVE